MTFMEICMKIAVRLILIFTTILYFNFSIVQAQINFWQQTTDFTNKPILSLAFDKKGNLYAGTEGDGIYHSTDKGKTWIRFSSGLNDLTVRHIAINLKDYIYVGTGSGGGIFASSGGVFRSTNEGIDWKYVGVSGTSSGVVVNSKDQLFAASSRYDPYSSIGGGLLLRSNDDGISWPDTLLNTFITGVNIDSADNIFTITNNILRSIDNGITFEKLYVQTNYYSPINSIFFDEANEVFYTQDGRVSRSTDNGKSWATLGNGLNGNIYAIIADNNHNIYAAAYYGNGIYCLKNNSNVRITDNTGLTDTNFSIYNWAKDTNGNLYCGTITGKVFYGIYSPSNVEESNNLFPLKFNLEQNYPNPFNPTTIINYQIPKRGLVVLKVYDILGREVTTLVNEEKQAGSYEVEFNGSSFSSGVYFYRIEAGSFSDTKKLLLLK